MHNDYELVYLYQTEFLTGAANVLYQQYLSDLNAIQWWVYRKYHSLPLEYHDLDFVKYQSFMRSVARFDEHYNRSFKNYVIQNCIWDLHTYIKRFLSANHQILNGACDLGELDYQLGDQNAESFLDKWTTTTKLHYLHLAPQILTPQECSILKLRLKGYDYQAIIEATGLSYKKVDNLIQRIIYKYKKIWIKNHV